MRAFFSLILASLMIMCVNQPTFAEESDGGIQVVPVPPAPEPENVVLRLVFPKENEIEKNPVSVQMRVEGFPLGVVSGLEREKELGRSKLGQSLHILIDDKPYFPRIGARIDPFDSDGNYFHATYRFKLPYPLAEGMHTIRVFPARAFGESLKLGQVFVSRCFAVRSKKGTECYDLSSPYLTYNEPSNLIPHPEKKPVLLDFYLSNCTLSEDGFKVKVTIDSKIDRTLTAWSPYYIYGLKKGSHKIRLQLLDKNDVEVEGAFNDVERYFDVQ